MTPIWWRWENALPSRVSGRGTFPPASSVTAPEGRGIPPHFPYIKGQNKGYILRQLISFAFLKRADDPQGLMRGIARRLSQKERQAVAEYFASLTPPPADGQPDPPSSRKASP